MRKCFERGDTDRPLGLMLIALMLMLATHLANAAEEISLHSGRDKWQDYQALRYFCSPLEVAVPADRVINSAASLPWISNGAGVPNIGLNKSVCWFHLRVRNIDHANADWLLVSDQPLLQEIDVYLRGGDGRIIGRYNVGNDRPFANRPYPSDTFAFPLSLPPQGQAVDVFMRVRTTSLQLPLEVVTSKYFTNDALRRNLIQGFFFGSMFIMILYNLLLYVSIRERAYILYVLWSAIITLIQLDLQGIDVHYLWPAGYHTMPILLPLGVIFGSWFTLEFLSLRQRAPIAAILLRAHIVLGFLAFCFAAVVDQYYSISVSIPLFLSMDITIFGTALYRSVKRDPDARLFGLAWLCFILGAAALSLAKMDLLPHNLLTSNLAQIGSFIEVGLLSLALAYRIKRLKASKADAEMQAVAANVHSKASSEFLSTMSHEIRTPMNGVLGLTDLLRHTPLNSQQQQYVDTIYHSSTMLLTIINDVLDYSRIEAGQLQLECVKTAVDDLLDSCVSLFRATAIEKSLDLTTRVDQDVPSTVLTDPVRVEQILNNLVSNALKFTENGSIRITVARADPGKDGLPQLEFAVEDTGPGLSAEQCNRLFTAFTQMDNSTTRRHGGSGLGLSICRQLCNLLGGKIGVSSQPGLGSRFWFRIPALSLPDTGGSDDLHGKVMLAAIADNDLRDSVQLMASRWGMIVRTARDLHELGDAATLAGVSVIVVGPEYNFTSLVTAPPRLPVILLRHTSQPPLPAVRPGNIHAVVLPLERATLRGRLQIAVSPEAPTAAPAAAAYVFDSQLHVLVAEDNIINQLVIRSILGSVGIDAVVVENGIQAFEQIKARSGHWNIIFMDCEMPEMDGYEATQRIRAWERNSDAEPCWIIALSAHASSNLVEKARLSGVDDYLSKPVTRQHVIDALKRHGNPC